MGKKFKIYCKDLYEDGEGFVLFFEVDGKVEDKLDCGCFDNVLIEVYDFWYSNLEKYNYDDRIDTMETLIRFSDEDY